MALTKKKEQLALAQLKTKQVLREQELKRKRSELQYAKQFVEAQVEEERAAVSFNVYEKVEGQGASSNVEDYDERLAELATDGTNMGGNQEMAEVKANMLTVEESTVGEHPSVRPTPVIQESPKILSVVKGENLAEPHNQESPQTPFLSIALKPRLAWQQQHARLNNLWRQAKALEKTLQEFYIKLFPCRRLNTCDSMEIL